jgi:hypothetical protein
MTQPRNWLEDVLEDASQKVAARPAWQRSAYWEEERRKIEERRNIEQQAQAAAKETEK